MKTAELFDLFLVVVVVVDDVVFVVVVVVDVVVVFVVSVVVDVELCCRLRRLTSWSREVADLKDNLSLG